MKKLLLIVFLISSSSTLMAQIDYCKDIKKLNIARFTPTPTFKAGEPIIQIAFSTTVLNETKVMLGFVSTADFSGATNINASVTFDDGDMLTFSQLPTVVLPKSMSSLTNVNVALSGTDFNKFAKKKVKAFTMGSNTTAPFTDDLKNKVMGYAICLITASQGVPNNTVSSSTTAASATLVMNANEKKSIDGFWGMKFGTSPDDAKAAMIAKGAKLATQSSKADVLIFTDAVFTDRKVEQISVRFVDGKFYEAVIVFPAPEEAQVMNQFKTMISELNNVYGEGSIHKSFEPPYADGDGYEVSALKLGKASFFCDWKTNNGNTIQLQLTKDLTFGLFYTDRTLEKLKTAKKSADY